MLKYTLIGVFFGLLTLCYVTTDNPVYRNRMKAATVLMLIAVVFMQFNLK